MPITHDTLAGLQRRDGRAITTLFEAYLPTVFRMAYGLTGHEQAAKRVLHFIIRTSMNIAPRWEHEEAPTRWFHHHTVLAARREKAQPKQAQDDMLIPDAKRHDAAYVAFVRALRNLPRQQMEAFLLHHGEGWDQRHLGIAMDCSRQAAQQHLDAADDTLAKVSGESFDILISQLAQAYRRLTPPQELILPLTAKHIRRHLLPRRIRQWSLLLLILTAIVLALWVAWSLSG